MEKRGWRVTASSFVVDTKFLRLRKDTIELPNGSVVNDYYVRDSPGFVIVCALTADSRIVLVRQYKHGIGKELLEMPAGAIDPGESPKETAERELREETGYTADSIEHVRTLVVEPTNSNSICHLFLARNARQTAAQDLDITEDIQVQTVSLNELRSLVRAGTIDSIPHVASIYLLFDLQLLA